jgi:hypothetical protein
MYPIDSRSSLRLCSIEDGNQILTLIIIKTKNEWRGKRSSLGRITLARRLESRNCCRIKEIMSSSTQRNLPIPRWLLILAYLGVPAKLIMLSL